MEVIESGASGLLKLVKVSLATNVFINIYGGFKVGKLVAKGCWGGLKGLSIHAWIVSQASFKWDPKLGGVIHILKVWMALFRSQL